MMSDDTSPSGKATTNIVDFAEGKSALGHLQKARAAKRLKAAFRAARLDAASSDQKTNKSKKKSKQSRKKNPKKKR